LLASLTISRGIVLLKDVNFIGDVSGGLTVHLEVGKVYFCTISPNQLHAAKSVDGHRHITQWLNVGRVHTQKMAGTDVTPSDRDGSDRLFQIVCVLMGSNGDDLFVYEENESGFLV